MISLKNIKLAVFDFDDTLAVHEEWGYAPENHVFLEQAYKNPETFYDEIDVRVAPASMQRLVVYCRRHDIKMLVLSYMTCSLHLEARKKFVEQHYGEDIEFHLTGSNAQKIDAMQVLGKTYNAAPDEILFVDDYIENIKRAWEAGFIAVLPNAVEELITDTGRRLDHYSI